MYVNLLVLLDKEEAGTGWAGYIRRQAWYSYYLRRADLSCLKPNKCSKINIIFF